MKFFDKNILGIYNEGVIAGSSGSPKNAFNENMEFGYQSEGQSLDGDVVFLERELLEESDIDAIFITETNILDLVVETKVIGGLWEPLDSGLYNLEKSKNGRSFYFNFKDSLLIGGIRVSGSLANGEEKVIENIFAFGDLGEIIGFDSLEVKTKESAKLLPLDAGGSVVINKGKGLEISFAMKINSNKEDTDTAGVIRNMTSNFFIWINGGYDNNFKVSQFPYRYGDIIKVNRYGQDKIGYYKGQFSIGITFKIKLYQAGFIV